MIHGDSYLALCNLPKSPRSMHAVKHPMPRLLSSVIFACRHPRRPHPLEKRESPENPASILVQSDRFRLIGHSMANDRAHAKEDRVLPKVGINLSGTAIPYSEMLEVSMSDSRQRIAIAAAVLAASLATLAVLSNAQTSHPTRQPPPTAVPRQTLRIRISLPDSKGLRPKGLIPSGRQANQAGLRSDIENYTL